MDLSKGRPEVGSRSQPDFPAGLARPSDLPFFLLGKEGAEVQDFFFMASQVLFFAISIEYVRGCKKLEEDVE